MKVQTIVGIFIFVSRENFIAEQKNVSANKYEKRRSLIKGYTVCSAIPIRILLKTIVAVVSLNY